MFCYNNFKKEKGNKMLKSRLVTLLKKGEHSISSVYPDVVEDYRNIINE
jgi:ribosomal protein S20